MAMIDHYPPLNPITATNNTMDPPPNRGVDSSAGNEATRCSSTAATRTESSDFGQMFKSIDALQKLLENGDGDEISDQLSELFRRGEFSNFESVFKSGDRSELEKLMKSGDSQKFLSLFQSVGSLKNGRNVSKGSQKVIPGVFESRDWAPAFASSHVDIDPNAVFQSVDDSTSRPVAVADLKRVAGTDWEALYESSLPSYPLPSAGLGKEAIAQIQRPPVAETSLLKYVTPAAAAASKDTDAQQAVEDVDVSKNTAVVVARRLKKSSPRPSAEAADQSSPNRRSKRDPAVKLYYEPHPDDVLLGRGGRTNHHPGNKKYLQEKEEMQARYMAASKQDKTGVSQELVDRVHARGGRFLELDPTSNKWFEVTNIKARKKASQSLREVNTPEERAAKRAKYGK